MRPPGSNPERTPNQRKRRWKKRSGSETGKFVKKDDGKEDRGDVGWGSFSRACAGITLGGSVAAFVGIWAEVAHPVAADILEKMAYIGGVMAFGGATMAIGFRLTEAQELKMTKRAENTGEKKAEAGPARTKRIRTRQARAKRVKTRKVQTREGRKWQDQRTSETPTK